MPQGRLRQTGTTNESTQSDILQIPGSVLGEEHKGQRLYGCVFNNDVCTTPHVCEGTLHGVSNCNTYVHDKCQQSATQFNVTLPRQSLSSELPWARLEHFPIRFPVVAHLSHSDQGKTHLEINSNLVYTFHTGMDQVHTCIRIYMHSLGEAT